jgi:HEAT repeat protein
MPALADAIALEPGGGWWVAVKALRQVAGTDAVPILVKALEHENADIRLTSVRELSSLGPAAKDAVPALKNRLDDERLYIRKAAAEAIQKIETPQASP